MQQAVPFTLSLVVNDNNNVFKIKLHRLVSLHLSDGVALSFINAPTSAQILQSWYPATACVQDDYLVIRLDQIPPLNTHLTIQLHLFFDSD